MRAAALSYGVMQELRDTNVTYQGDIVSVLDQVDSISAVSGGSFTAAYYGVFGEKIFEDYESVFLRQDIQSSLIKRIMQPGYWISSLFSGFDRTEMAVDYYDRTIFKGATFGDIPLDKRPFIRINATDLASGMRFDFTQGRFDLLCSDLNEFSIARAVTASSAVPVMFSTVVVENYADQCDLSEVDGWQHLKTLEPDSLAEELWLENVISYRDVEERNYIHLVDGGISDNLGVRSVIELMDVFEDDLDALIFKSAPKSVLVVLVNAETRPDKIIEKTASKPSIGATVGAFSNAQISRYNIETKRLLQRKLDLLELKFAKAGHDTKVYFIEVGFRDIPIKEVNRLFNNLPTSLELNDEEIDKLIATGRVMLRINKSFQSYLDYHEGGLKEGVVSTDELCEVILNDRCEPVTE